MTTERLAQQLPHFAPPRGLLARLQAETRPDHDAIEQLLDLTRSGMTLAAYRHTLERFYGFYLPLEDQLCAIGGWPERGLDLGERLKAPLLAADLAALGLDAPSNLPTCEALPDLADVTAAFGCLYVLEGATLGGQVISRSIRSIIGDRPEAGGLFFHGYGERTGAMWRAFREALTACTVNEDTHDGVVVAASATFRALRRWCEQGQLR